MSKTLRVLVQGVLFGGFVAVIPASAEGLSAPTFTKDVAPIFQEKCEACHRPDSIAPMSLVTFEEVRPWARSIKARVVARQMPPWHISKTVGIQHFKNDRSLTDAEIDTIVALGRFGRAQGRPEGHAARRRSGRAIRAGTLPRCSIRTNPT